MLHKVICAILFLVVSCTAAFADEVTFEASVDADTVELGSSFQLTLTINGTDKIPPVQLPKIDGLDTRYLGPSTRISIINGQMSRSTGLVFSVVPLRTGEFEIPAITLNLDGKDFTSQAMRVRVVDSGALTPPSAAAGANNSVSALQDKVFIVLGTPQKEVYLNEPVPLTIKLFINDLALRNIQYPVFAHDGFDVDPFGEPRRYTQNLGGVQYQVLEFKTMIYPQRTGEQTLGPAQMSANILFRTTRRSGPSPFDRFGDVFDDDIFESFFGGYETKTITLQSADLTLSVLPLPEQGRPQDFNGAVGQYDFQMSVSPQNVSVGDPVTVTMKVAGEGHLKNVTMPAIQAAPDFKVYDPKITEQGNTKILEQVVIPNSVAVKELPLVRFSFFDTAQKQYRVITQGPFALTVTPLAKGQEAKVVGLTPDVDGPVLSSASEELGRDLRFIKENIGTIKKRGTRVCQEPVFAVFIVVVLALWAGLFARYKIQHKLSTDTRFARKLIAPRQARQGLARAKDLLARAEVSGFYDEIFRTLQGYLGNKFHLAAGSVSAEKIESLFPAHKDKARLIEILRAIFAECEQVRYAAVSVDHEKMKAAFEQTEKLIDQMERTVR